MSYTYYPPETIPAAFGVDGAELRHKYYVQLGPDGKHLVPGMLQQGRRARTGSWLEAGDVSRALPGRYFVQYTDFNTLVPGSLIQGKRMPRGRWKEVIKGTKSIFHRVYSPDYIFTFSVVSPPNSYSLHEDYGSVSWHLSEILPYVYPEGNIDHTYKLYYFNGSFDELDNDASKLTLFSSEGAMLRLHDMLNSSFIDTLGVWPDTVMIEMNTDAEEGSYCFVLGILNDEDEVVEYIVIENVVNRVIA